MWKAINNGLLPFHFRPEGLRAMACNFFCGGDRTEDINAVKEKLHQRPSFKLCSPDTVLRQLSELAVNDIVYTLERGKEYIFNNVSSRIARR